MLYNHTNKLKKLFGYYLTNEKFIEILYETQKNNLNIIFANIILNFRFIVIVPIFFVLLSTLKFFVIGTLAIISGLYLGFEMVDPEGNVTNEIVSHLIGGLDYYLIGIVLLIFAFGMYELFISKISITNQYQELRILKIESLEELKTKLIQVIVVALIVSLFKKVINIDIKQASDLVYIASAILLTALSSYLLHLQNKISGK